MKIKSELERCRVIRGFYASQQGDDFGAFIINGPCGRDLTVMASSGDPDNNPPILWEHVSVSLKNRCPNWEEMCYVKSLFWDDEETVMQLHPPKSKWINNHPYCLHMWRPIPDSGIEIPLPPDITVGVQAAGQLREA